MNIYFGEEASAQLSILTNSYDKFFLLTDENVYEIYSSMIASLLPEKEINKIILPSGEQSKNIENVVLIWDKLIESKAGRDSLLINFGGGTISDIGGFAASCYKRGIDFVNIPTTLLAMVDASIGGKNAINFKNYKNQIGLFSEPKSIIINPEFLKTLNKRDIYSGMAEIMKYAFIADESLMDLDIDNYLDFIKEAATIKDEIVNMDMKETGLRKILNFGHTIGHALESYYMERDNCLTHGEAVALGIYASLYLSKKYCGLDDNWIMFYDFWFRGVYDYIILSDLDVEKVFSYLSYDKKNKGGKPKFVLISAPEKPQIDVEVRDKDIKDAISLLRGLL